MALSLHHSMSLSPNPHSYPMAGLDSSPKGTDHSNGGKPSSRTKVKTSISRYLLFALLLLLSNAITLFLSSGLSLSSSNSNLPWPTLLNRRGRGGGGGGIGGAGGDDMTAGYGSCEHLVGDLLARYNQTRDTLDKLRSDLSFVLSEVKTNANGTDRLQLDLSRLVTIFRAAGENSKDEEDNEEEDQERRRGKSGKDPWLAWSHKNRESMSKELREYIAPRKFPLGRNHHMKSEWLTSPIGHSCAIANADGDLDRFMDYEVGKLCPDDEFLTQQLLLRGCEPLPRRRCLARTPLKLVEPNPIPASFWTIPSDDAFVWTAYTCKNITCLNDRKKHKVFEDCIDCFELTGRERWRWLGSGDNGLDLSIDEVLELKNGSIRIGLDIGGGTGTFAVRMHERNVTIVTTSMNLNGPFNNYIAARGVVPLYITVSQRLPFFDNTLDLVHSMHVLSNWIPLETFQFILFDIDRILRPGGLFWLDHFFCIADKLTQDYLPLIESLGYKKLKWAVGPKLDRGPDIKEVYLSAVLEKPLHPVEIAE